MKYVLWLMMLAAVFMCGRCSIDDPQRAKSEGYDDGFDQAKYYAQQCINEENKISDIKYCISRLQITTKEIKL